VSILILGIGLAGAWLATRGSYLYLLAGAFLFQMQSILDGCDGEMSRLTFRGSKAGEWLDTVGDDLTNYGFFAAAGYGLSRATASPLYLYASAVVVTCGLLTSAIEYRYLISIGSGDLLKYPLGIGAALGAKGEKSIADYISPLFKRDTFVFLTLVAAALGLTGIMLLVFAVGAVGIFVAVIKAELRMANERRRAPH
jgi:CDP-L-myo-inositol myo-inositolphosphotransferase